MVLLLLLACSLSSAACRHEVEFSPRDGAADARADADASGDGAPAIDVADGPPSDTSGVDGWSQVDLSTTGIGAAQLRAISGSLQNGIYVVGQGIGGGVALYSFSGDSWAKDEKLSSSAPLDGVWVSPDTAVARVVVVGAQLWWRTEPSAIWTTHSLPSAGKAVWGTKQTVNGVSYVATASGQLTRWERTFQPGASPCTDNKLSLDGVWATGQGTDVFAVGAAGTTRYWSDDNAAVCSEQVTPTTKDLHAVHGVDSPLLAYAVGAEGVVLKLAGTAPSWTWQPVAGTPPDETYYGVFVRSPSDIWIVGCKGQTPRVRHYDGTGTFTDMTPRDPGGATCYRGVWADSERVWVVGDAAALLYIKTKG